MWTVVAITIAVVVLVGCAVAIGEGSVAAVHNRTDTRREVDSGTTTIEDVLSDRASSPQPKEKLR